jgi:hypothetical protein
VRSNAHWGAGIRQGLAVPRCRADRKITLAAVPAAPRRQCPRDRGGDSATAMPLTRSLRAGCPSTSSEPPSKRSWRLPRAQRTISAGTEPRRRSATPQGECLPTTGTPPPQGQGKGLYTQEKGTTMTRRDSLYVLGHFPSGARPLTAYSMSYTQMKSRASLLMDLP